MGDADVTAVPAKAAPRTRSRRRRLLLGAIGVTSVVLTFAFVLPRIADYRDVWQQLEQMSWADLAALLGATVLNVLTFAPPWMAALPALTFRQALAMTQASTAVSIVSPAGAAVGMASSYAMLRSWGFPGDGVGLAVTLTGIWNQLASFAFPTLALATLFVAGEPHAVLQPVAAVGLAVLVAIVVSLALVLRSDRQARWIGDLVARLADRGLWAVRRGPVIWTGESFVRFRQAAATLLRRRWHVLTLATLAGHLTVFIVLLLSLRAVGVPASQVSLSEAFAAWALVRALGAIPIAPGGIGVVELALTGALVGFGGNNAGVVAGVLVYRGLTILPTLGLGLLAGATWRHHAPKRT